VVGEVVSLLINRGGVEGVLLRSGEKLFCKSVVITCGTFLSGVIHVGDRKILAGRMGESSSIGITEHLKSMGFKTMRLKTGTPPRVLKSSIDWEKTSIDFGDKNPVPFSFFTKNFAIIFCFLIKIGSSVKSFAFFFIFFLHKPKILFASSFVKWCKIPKSKT